MSLISFILFILILKKNLKMLPVQNYFDTLWHEPFKDEFKSCDYSHPEMAQLGRNFGNIHNEGKSNQSLNILCFERKISMV